MSLRHLGQDVDGNTPMEMARVDGHTDAFEVRKAKPFETADWRGGAGGK